MHRYPCLLRTWPVMQSAGSVTVSNRLIRSGSRASEAGVCIWRDTEVQISFSEGDFGQDSITPILINQPWVAQLLSCVPAGWMPRAAFLGLGVNVVQWYPNSWHDSFFKSSKLVRTDSVSLPFTVPQTLSLQMISLLTLFKVEVKGSVNDSSKGTPEIWAVSKIFPSFCPVLHLQSHHCSSWECACAEWPSAPSNTALATSVCTEVC